MRPLVLKYIVAAILLSICQLVPSHGATVVMLGDNDPVQGEIFRVRVVSGSELKGGKIRYGTTTVSLRCEGHRAQGFFGFDLSEPPGLKEVEIILYHGVKEEIVIRRVTLVDANFPVERLDGLSDSFVNPGRDDMRRIRKESTILRSIWKSSKEKIYWDDPFSPPFAGFSGKGFGKKRVINGEKRNPHTGVDSHAKRGTPVGVINGGIVRLARDLFFSGFSVVVDHGGGLFSMYFHLDEVSVKEGDTIGKGAVIGTVGSSGRATGPHLHLGVRFVNMRVNPMDLLK